jgi:DeoR family fructose operon transcriptional repressor
MPLKYKERYKQIAELIKLKKRVLVSELGELFKVSEVTIRKDLNQLEEMGLCRRFHSGAVAADIGVFDIPVKHKVTQNRNLKEKIARTAAQMIKENTTTILDAGSSVHMIAGLLHGRKNIRIVTNSLMVGTELADERGIDLILSGGSVRSESQALVGSIALETFGKIHVDLALIGAMGVSEQRGFTSATLAEAQGKQAMIAAARETVIVADSSKLDKNSFMTFAALKDVKMLITDAEADPRIIKKLNKTGLEILVAEG